MSQLILIVLTLVFDAPAWVDGPAPSTALAGPPHAAQEEPKAQPKPVEPPAAPEEEPAAKPAAGAEAAPQEEEPAGEDQTQAEARTAEPVPEEPEEAIEPQEPDFLERWKNEGKFKARFGLRYDYRRYSNRPFESIQRGTDRDHLFRSYLEAETHGLGHEKLHSYVHLEWLQDLNDVNDPSFTNQLVNTYGSDGRFYLYSGYAEAQEVWDRIQLRVGRQQVMEVHPVTFDGASARMDRFYLLDMPAEVRLFGGAITRFHTNLDDTWVGGGGLLVHPHETIALEVRDTAYQKNRLEAEGRWRPLEMLSVLGMYGFLNGKSRDARAEADLELAAVDLTVTGGYYQLFHHDYRLDYLTGQDTRGFTDRYLFFPQLAPYIELYLRAGWNATDWLSVGGEYIDHKLRDRYDESPYDVDFREGAGWIDLRLGPATLRSEARYYRADRNAVPVLQPRFPQPPVLTQAKVGEKDHLELHLRGRVELGKPGWTADAGLVWHRLDYTDVYQSVDDETSIDYYVQLRARLSERTSFVMRYELTRDMTYFMPYFDHMHAFRWMLDVTL